MAMIQLAAGTVGGLVQGNFGSYPQQSDGTFLVDTRDAPAMLTLGMQYANKSTRVYNPPAAPLVATVGKIVASAALSNGALTIANQVDVPRPAVVVIGTGAAAITAGVASLTYIANDGTTQIDVVPLNLLASTGATVVTSKGVQKMVTGVVSGLVGGSSPFIHIDTTATISVPVDPGAVDFGVYAEYVDGVAETNGAVVAGSLGGITPTTAPNGTHLYSFGYTFVSPVA